MEVCVEENVQETIFGREVVARAVFSKCGNYRYFLERCVTTDEPHSKPRLAFVMLNPSRATAFRLDPTVRRCIYYAQREGAGVLVVLNLFAYRSPQPAALRGKTAEVASGGPTTDHFLREGLAGCQMVICGWGNDGDLYGRVQAVTQLIGESGVPAYCLGYTQQGQPYHPLYQPTEAPLLPYPRGDNG